eukprot:m.179133 g.179133  ORF g.179133 m.179133 type:complete len:1722 (-) comp13566_c0_seq2:127-5292(-)
MPPITRKLTEVFLDGGRKDLHRIALQLKDSCDLLLNGKALLKVSSRFHNFIHNVFGNLVSHPSGVFTVAPIDNKDDENNERSLQLKREEMFDMQFIFDICQQVQKIKIITKGGEYPINLEFYCAATSLSIKHMDFRILSGLLFHSDRVSHVIVRKSLFHLEELLQDCGADQVNKERKVYTISKEHTAPTLSHNASLYSSISDLGDRSPSHGGFDAIAEQQKEEEDLDVSQKRTASVSMVENAIRMESQSSASSTIYPLWSNLSILDVSDNKIEFITDSLQHAPDLRELHLSQNEVQGLSMSLVHVPRLHTLYLAFNYLSSLASIPEIVQQGGLKNLTCLSVAQNNIRSLEGVEALSNLTTFDASFNAISEIEEVKRYLVPLPFLRDVHLEGNPLMLKIDAAHHILAQFGARRWKEIILNGQYYADRDDEVIVAHLMKRAMRKLRKEKIKASLNPSENVIRVKRKKKKKRRKRKGDDDMTSIVSGNTSIVDVSVVSNFNGHDDSFDEYVDSELPPTPTSNVVVQTAARRLQLHQQELDRVEQESRHRFEVLKEDFHKPLPNYAMFQQNSLPIAEVSAERNDKINNTKSVSVQGPKQGNADGVKVEFVNSTSSTVTTTPTPGNYENVFRQLYLEHGQKITQPPHLQSSNSSSSSSKTLTTLSRRATLSPTQSFRGSFDNSQVVVDSDNRPMESFLEDGDFIEGADEEALIEEDIGVSSSFTPNTNTGVVVTSTPQRSFGKVFSSNGDKRLESIQEQQLHHDVEGHVGQGDIFSHPINKGMPINNASLTIPMQQPTNLLLDVVGSRDNSSDKDDRIQTPTSPRTPSPVGSYPFFHTPAKPIKPPNFTKRNLPSANSTKRESIREEENLVVGESHFVKDENSKLYSVSSTLYDGVFQPTPNVQPLNSSTTNNDKLREDDGVKRKLLMESAPPPHVSKGERKVVYLDETTENSNQENSQTEGMVAANAEVKESHSTNGSDLNTTVESSNSPKSKGLRDQLLSLNKQLLTSNQSNPNNDVRLPLYDDDENVFASEPSASSLVEENNSFFFVNMVTSYGNELDRAVQISGNQMQIQLSYDLKPLEILSMLDLAKTEYSENSDTGECVLFLTFVDSSEDEKRLKFLAREDDHEARGNLYKLSEICSAFEERNRGLKAENFVKRYECPNCRRLFDPSYEIETLKSKCPLCGFETLRLIKMDLNKGDDESKKNTIDSEEKVQQQHHGIEPSTSKPQADWKLSKASLNSSISTSACITTPQRYKTKSSSTFSHIRSHSETDSIYSYNGRNSIVNNVVETHSSGQQYEPLGNEVLVESGETDCSSVVDQLNHLSSEDLVSKQTVQDAILNMRMTMNDSDQGSNSVVSTKCIYFKLPRFAERNRSSKSLISPKKTYGVLVLLSAWFGIMETQPDGESLEFQSLICQPFSSIKKVVCSLRDQALVLVFDNDGETESLLLCLTSAKDYHIIEGIFKEHKIDIVFGWEHICDEGNNDADVNEEAMAPSRDGKGTLSKTLSRFSSKKKKVSAEDACFVIVVDPLCERLGVSVFDTLNLETEPSEDDESGSCETPSSYQRVYLINSFSRVCNNDSNELVGKLCEGDEDEENGPIIEIGQGHIDGNDVRGIAMCSIVENKEDGEVDSFDICLTEIDLGTNIITQNVSFERYYTTFQWDPSHPLRLTLVESNDDGEKDEKVFSCEFFSPTSLSEFLSAANALSLHCDSIEMYMAVKSSQIE